MLSLVPDEVEQYARDHTSTEPEVFRELARVTKSETEEPEMQVGPIEGLFLKNLVRAMSARRILEIGTFTGYSALMMAEGMADGGELITCDIDRETTAIARAHWDRSPGGARITLKLGRAIETIEHLDGPFDLVFIDADKESYIDYWDAVVPKVRSGGLILADNVLWSGKVLEPQEPIDHAIVEFNRHVNRDTRVDRVMLTVRDGITMACKR